jgi:peptidoglycan-associated lipoprotein
MTTETVVPPPTDVEQPEEPSTTADVTEDPLSGDLQEVNAYAQEAGLLGDVYFDYDEAELKSEARDRLSKNADFMRQRLEFTFTIEGHADERGTNEYNLALGERRASAAKSYLTSLGIDASRVNTISYGEERPVCTVTDESCWWRNRRAGFVVTGRTTAG